MKRTYLLQVRLKISIASALSASGTFANDDVIDEAMWDLVPDDAVSLSRSGNTLVLAHSTDSEPSSLLEELRKRFRSLPIDAIAVLEIGHRCKASDDEADDGTDDTEINLERWLSWQRPDFVEERPTFGPKAILLVTDGRPPESLRCLSSLRKAFPTAQPNWHGPTTILLAFHSDHSVGHVWGHPAVQRALTDSGVDYLACFEIGAAEAASNSLAQVLPRCQRAPAGLGRTERPNGPTRTVVVERVRRRETKQGEDRGRLNRGDALPGGGMTGATGTDMGLPIGDPKNLPPANDHLQGVNDNQFRSTRVVPTRSPRKGRPPRSQS